MKGKEKCKALKEIRRKIAEENDIAYAVEECSHKGECKGTCPKCESELRYLERELEKKRRLGEKVAIAGVSVGAMAALAGCNPVEDIVINPMRTAIETVQDMFGRDPEPLGGEAVLIEPEMGEPTVVDPYIYGNPDDELDGEETYCPEDDPFYVPEDDANQDGDGEEIYEIEGGVAMPIEEE